MTAFAASSSPAAALVLVRSERFPAGIRRHPDARISREGAVTKWVGWALGSLIARVGAGTIWSVGRTEADGPSFAKAGRPLVRWGIGVRTGSGGSAAAAARRNTHTGYVSAPISRSKTSMWWPSDSP
jgi:hypothetical protein